MKHLLSRSSVFHRHQEIWVVGRRDCYAFLPAGDLKGFHSSFLHQVEFHCDVKNGKIFTNIVIIVTNPYRYRLISILANEYQKSADSRFKINLLEILILNALMQTTHDPSTL